MKPSSMGRFEDLHTDRLLFGLSAEEEAEHARLLRSVPLDDRERLDWVVAELDVAWSDDHEPLPSQLRERVKMSATTVTPASQQPERRVSSRVTRRESLAWMVAVGATVAAVLFAFSQPSPPPAVGLAQRREQITAAAGTLRVDWAPGPTPIAGASGDVVWNPAKQEGYMRFRGLTPNDPAREQYQLWIFDKSQPEPTPIDGGVFDVGTADEVIVPIDAKLPAREVYLFAVTIEKPGGVVVSSRERLPLLAAVQ